MKIIHRKITASSVDKRLSFTSTKYKGYRISLDHENNCYNIYDKHGELEDSGYTSQSSAKEAIDKLLDESSVNTSISSVKQIMSSSMPYVKWVKKAEDGSWVMWGGSNSPDVDPSFLDRINHPNYSNPEYNIENQYVDYMVLPAGETPVESAQEINLPGYAVQWVSGYAGNGVNRTERKYFRTPEERDEFVKRLESQNATEIKTWTFENFYHTLPVESNKKVTSDEDIEYLDNKDTLTELINELVENGVDIYDDQDILQDLGANYGYDREDQFSILEDIREYVGEAIDSSESLEASSYGGAYDIEDDQYFTKEELVDFGNSICDEFNIWTGGDEPDIWYLESIYLTPEDKNLLEVNITDGDITLVSSVNVDMRRIHRPSDIYKYSQDIFEKLSSSYSEYFQGSSIEGTGFTEDKFNNIMSVENLDDEDLETADQEFTSKATSINKGKLPAIYKLVKFSLGDVVLDFGGGKFDNGVEYLESIGCEGYVYDPYNRTSEHNNAVIKAIRSNGGADIVLNSNVLNVIKESAARRTVLKNIKKLVKPSGKIYITVYEGNGSGEGKQSQEDSYQLNRKTADYLEEIQEVFPDATRKGKLIIATPNGTPVNSSIEASVSYEDINRTMMKAADIHDTGELIELLSDVASIDTKMYRHYCDLDQSGEYSPAAIGKMISDDLYWKLDNMWENETSSPNKDDLSSRIFDYLDECGGYTDYNQKIEDLVDEFNLDRDTAESYVWDWASGIKNMYEEDDIESCDSITSREVPTYKRSEFVKELQDELYDACSKRMQEYDMGFPLEEIANYLVIEVTDNGDAIVAEIRSELDYEGMDKLAEVCNPIVEKYDEYAYFDHVDSGIIESYIRLDSISSSNTITAKEYVDYENPIDTEKLYDVEFDNKIIVEDNLVYLDDDEVVESIEDEFYNGVQIDDSDGVAEKIVDLVMNNIPEENGIYRVSGVAKLKYLLENMYEVYDKPDGESSLPESSFYTEEISVHYDPYGSWIESLQVEKI